MNNERKNAEDQYEAQAEQFAAAAAEDGDVVNTADAIADTNLGQASANGVSAEDQAALFAAAAAEDGDVVNDADAIADTNLGQ